MLSLILIRNTPFLAQTCILRTLATKNVNFVFLKNKFFQFIYKKKMYIFILI